MPLLEFAQIRHSNVGLKFSHATVQRVDRYVAYIKSRTGVQIEASEAIERNALLGMDRDRDFVEFEKTPEAKNVPAVLRVRKVPAVGTTPSQPKPPAKAVEPSAPVAGLKA
jgi:hypothetical protein